MTSDRRAWLLFAGWFLTGACYLLALLTVLSVGLLILPVPVAGTLVLATRRDTRRSLPGLLSGASLPLFLLAYLNRHGPGTYCTSSATADSCTEGLLDPWLLLAGGLLVLAAGPALFLRTRRRRVNSSAVSPTA
ncbi:hypothetical protein [Streptomyces fuscichromogenes]|uniref:Uncharacterized protein n=1 Tax=Streptomyces fuscichromogenes TaxID=1324013 RepID=A0A917XGT7_9ACTN|nr:hypothetical protein [Streptomyces fuscichromogenes]GGN24510.1 hypothetical protein GCM10011578_057810 [Streptomyces fuscichromogenes]